MRMAAAIGGVLLIVSASLTGDEALTMRVSPAMSVEPADVAITVFITPDAANRAIEVVAESGDFYRSSEVALEGDNAPRESTFRYRDLPAGDYEIRGVLLGAGETPRALVRRVIKVMP